MRSAILITICITFCNAAIGQDACTGWFKASGIEIGTKRCFFECSQIGAGMGTWMCPQRCGEFCQYKPRVHFFFGNGMFNTPQDAWASTVKLSEAINSEIQKYPDLKGITDPKIRVMLSYNVSEDAFDQLQQVIRQKLNAEQSEFFRWLGNLDIAPHWFRRAAQQISFKIDETQYVSDIDLKDHVEKYTRVLERDETILVVSHSQGNLYSHAAFSRLGRPQEMRIIPIASPYYVEMSERLYNGWPYTTLYSDGVMRLIPFSYPPNVMNPSPGLWDHGFVKHYLGGANSGPKIRNDVMCIVGTFLMRLRPAGINWYLDSEWEHPTCRNLTPHPEYVRDRRREEKEER